MTWLLRNLNVMSNTNGNAGGDGSDLPPGWTLSISKSQPNRVCYQHVNGRRMFRRPTAADDTTRQPTTTPSSQPNATGRSAGAIPGQDSRAPSPASGRGAPLVVASMPLTSLPGSSAGWNSGTNIRAIGLASTTAGIKSVTAVLPDLSTAGRPLVAPKTSPPPTNDTRKPSLSGLEQPAKHGNAPKPSLPPTNDTRQAPLSGLEQPSKHGNTPKASPHPTNDMRKTPLPGLEQPAKHGNRGVGDQNALKSGTTPTIILSAVPSASAREKPIGTVPVTTQSSTKEQPRAASPKSPSRVKVAAPSAQSAAVPPSTPNTKETSASTKAVSTPSPSKPQQPRSGSRVVIASGPKPSPSKLRAAVTSEDLAEFEFGGTEASKVKTSTVARNLEGASSLSTHERASDDAKNGPNRHDINPLNVVSGNDTKTPIDANPLNNHMGNEKKTPNGDGEKAMNEDGSKTSGGGRTESSTVKSEEIKQTIGDSNKPASDAATQVNKAIRLEPAQSGTTKSSSAPTALKAVHQEAKSKASDVQRMPPTQSPGQVFTNRFMTSAPSTRTVSTSTPEQVAPQPATVAPQPATVAPQPATVAPPVAAQTVTVAPQKGSVIPRSAIASQPATVAPQTTTTALPQPAPAASLTAFVPPVKVSGDHSPKAASRPVPLPKASDNNPPASLGPVPPSVSVPPNAGTDHPLKGASVGQVVPSNAGADPPKGAPVPSNTGGDQPPKVASVGPVAPSNAGGGPPLKVASVGPVPPPYSGTDPLKVASVVSVAASSVGPAPGADLLPPRPASAGPVPSKVGGADLPPPRPSSAGPVPSKVGGADLPPPRPSSAGPVPSYPVRSSSLMTRRSSDSRVGRATGRQDEHDSRRSRRDRSRSRDHQRNQRSRSSSYRKRGRSGSRDRGGRSRDNRIPSSSHHHHRGPSPVNHNAPGEGNRIPPSQQHRGPSPLPPVSSTASGEGNGNIQSQQQHRGPSPLPSVNHYAASTEGNQIQSHNHRGPSPLPTTTEGNRSIQSQQHHLRGPSPLPPTFNATTEGSRGPPVAIAPHQAPANLQPPQLVYPGQQKVNASAQSHLQQQLHYPSPVSRAASTTQSRSMPVYAPVFNFSNQATTVPQPPASVTSTSVMRTTVNLVPSGGGAPAYVPSMPSYTPIASPPSTTSLATATNRPSESGGLRSVAATTTSERSSRSNGEAGLALAAATEVHSNKRLREDVPIRPRVEIVAARTIRRQRNMEAIPVPADSSPIVAHGAAYVQGKKLLSSLTETMQTLQIPIERRTNIITFVQQFLQIAPSSSVFVLRPPSSSSLGTIPTVALDSINKVKEFLGLLSDEEAVARAQRLGDATDDEQIADDTIGRMTGRYPIGFQRDEPLEIPMLREAWMCRVIEEEIVVVGDPSPPARSVVFIVETSKSKTELGRGTSPVRALRAALNNSRFWLRRKQVITKSSQKQDDEKFGSKGTEATTSEVERATGKFHVDMEMITDDSSASTKIKVRRLRFHRKEVLEHVLKKGDEGQDVGTLMCPGDVVTLAGDKEYTYVSDEDIVKHAADLIWFTFQPSFEWFSPFEELMSLLDSMDPQTRSLLHSVGGLSLDCVELDDVEGELGHELFGLNLERVSMMEARLKSKSLLRCFTSQLLGVDLTIAFVTKKIRDAMETLHAKLRWMAGSNLFEARDATVWGEMSNDQCWFPQAVLLGVDDGEANHESNAFAAVDESANVSSGEDPLAAAPPEEDDDINVLSDNELRQLMDETIFQSSLTRGEFNATSAASFFPAVIAELGLLSVDSSLSEEQWRHELQKAFDQQSVPVDPDSIRSFLRRPITGTTVMRDLREAYPQTTSGNLVAMLHRFYRSLLGPDTSKKTEEEEKPLSQMTCSEIRERILKGHERALEVYSLQGLEGKLRVLNGLYVISDTMNDLKVFTFVGSMDGNNADDQLNKIQGAFVGQYALFHFTATGVWALQRKDKQRMSDCLCVGQIGADFSSQQWVCATQESRQSPAAMLPAPAVKLIRFSLPEGDL